MQFEILGTANIGRAAMIPAIDETNHVAGAIASRDAEWTRRAADAGLDVLCEKPLTADAGVTLMEGFMYRFHPRTERARAVVSDALGEVRSVDATFNFRLRTRQTSGTTRTSAAAALFDAGSYAVNTALTGVLEYAGGRTGRVTTSFDTAGVQRYRVECVDGYLEANDCFVPGEDASLTYEVAGRRRSATCGFSMHSLRAPRPANPFASTERAEHDTASPDGRTSNTRM